MEREDLIQLRKIIAMEYVMINSKIDLADRSEINRSKLKLNTDSNTFARSICKEAEKQGPHALLKLSREVCRKIPIQDIWEYKESSSSSSFSKDLHNRLMLSTLVNRDEQDRGIEQLAASSEEAPIVFALHGFSHDQLNLYVDRLNHFQLNKLIPHVDSGRARPQVVTFDPPIRYRSKKDFVDHILHKLNRDHHRHTHSKEICVIDTICNRHHGHTIFWTQIDAIDIVKRTDLIQDIIGFWQEYSAKPRAYNFVVAILIEYRKPKGFSWFRKDHVSLTERRCDPRLLQTRGILYSVLPKVSDINKKHLVSWMGRKEVAESELGAKKVELLTRFEQEFTGNRNLSLNAFCEILKEQIAEFSEK